MLRPWTSSASSSPLLPCHVAMRSRRAVQGAEVLLHLAEVGQQLAGGGGELLVALADRGAVQQAGGRVLAELVNLALDVLLAALELVQALGGVGLGALGDLAQQVHRGLQARLGAHEGRFGKALNPGVGLLQGRGGVVVNLVRAQRVEATQEARLRAGPVGEVLRGRAQEPRVLRVLGVDGVELVVQRRHQLPLRAGAPALLHEEPAQHREQQRRVRGAQHPPGGMPLAQRLDLRVIHVGLLGVGGLSVTAARAPRGQSRSGGVGRSRSGELVSRSTRPAMPPENTKHVIYTGRLGPFPLWWTPGDER
jgi:hypothetical protein